jgi:hypothetical protein
MWLTGTFRWFRYVGPVMTNQRNRRIGTALSELRVALCAVLLCGPYIGLAWWLWRRNPPAAVAAFFAVTLIVWILQAVLSRTWRRFLLWQFPLFVLSLLFAGYTLRYGMVPGRPLAGVLATISLSNVLVVLSAWSVQRVLLVCTALCALYLWAAWRAPAVHIFREARRGRRALVLALTAALSLIAVLHADLMMDGIAAHPLVGSALFVGGPWRDARAASNDADMVRMPVDGAHDGLR